MPRAIVNPDEVRRFAHHLDRTSQRLRDEKAAATAAFSRLHDTWRDEKYVQFAGTFDDTIKALDRYIEQTERYSAFLKKKAGLADKYLEQR